MKLYADASALVKLVIVEAGSSDAAALWAEADDVTSAAVIAVEARAAVARRLRGRAADEARRELSHRLNGMVLLDVDETLLERAAAVTDRFRLRALDAVHLAAATLVRDESLLFASWDGELKHAAEEAGLTVAL